MQIVPWQGHTGHLNTGPSQWWSWGLAIFLSVMVFFSIIGIIFSALIPYDQLMNDWEMEEPGVYPTNGTSEEQDEWNSSKEEWDNYVATQKMMEGIDELSPIQIWSGLISSVIAIVSIFMLFHLDPNWYKVTYGWL